MNNSDEEFQSSTTKGTLFVRAKSCVKDTIALYLKGARLSVPDKSATFLHDERTSFEGRDILLKTFD